MRVLLISDIHSNLEALEACLAAAPPHDMAVNLGDIVGYGASPNEVIERSRALGHIFVRGNHDKAASGAMDLRDFNPIAGLAALWTRDQLTPQNLKWLLGLPHGPIQTGELPGIQFVHGSPVDEDEYGGPVRRTSTPRSRVGTTLAQVMVGCAHGGLVRYSRRPAVRSRFASDPASNGRGNPSVPSVTGSRGETKRRALVRINVWPRV
mgnify:CR=1 FL=1